MGFFLFILIVLAAILVSPYFLIAGLVLVMLWAWSASGRRYY